MLSGGEDESEIARSPVHSLESSRPDCEGAGGGSGDGDGGDGGEGRREALLREALKIVPSNYHEYLAEARVFNIVPAEEVNSALRIQAWTRFSSETSQRASKEGWGPDLIDKELRKFDHGWQDPYAPGSRVVQFEAPTALQLVRVHNLEGTIEQENDAQAGSDFSRGNMIGRWLLAKPDVSPGSRPLEQDWKVALPTWSGQWKREGEHWTGRAAFISEVEISPGVTLRVGEICPPKNPAEPLSRETQLQWHPEFQAGFQFEVVDDLREAVQSGLILFKNTHRLPKDEWNH